MSRGKQQYKKQNTREDILFAVQKEMEKRGYRFCYSLSTKQVKNVALGRGIKADGQYPESKMHRVWYTKEKAIELVDIICNMLLRKYMRFYAGLTEKEKRLADTRVSEWSQPIIEEPASCITDEAPLEDVDIEKAIGTSKAEEKGLSAGDSVELAMLLHESVRIFIRVTQILGKTFGGEL